MKNETYAKKANALGKAVDIAIDAMTKFPPKGFDEYQMNLFVNAYQEFKESALNPEPRFQNLKNLSEVEEGIMTYFQEASGNAVNYFWSQVHENNLGFKRKNKLETILKRQKIKNDQEYNFVIDIIVPYQQEGLINETDVIKLNDMISRYEGR